MIMVNSATRLEAVKDIKDLSLQSVRRIAQNPEDPRYRKAKSFLKTKGLSVDKKDNGSSTDKSTSDKESSKPGKPTQSTALQRSAERVNQIAIKRKAIATKAKRIKTLYTKAKAEYQKMQQNYKARMVRLRMMYNYLKEQYSSLADEHRDAVGKYRSLKKSESGK